MLHQPFANARGTASSDSGTRNLDEPLIASALRVSLRLFATRCGSAWNIDARSSRLASLAAEGVGSLRLLLVAAQIGREVVRVQSGSNEQSDQQPNQNAPASS